MFFSLSKTPYRLHTATYYNNINDSSSENNKTKQNDPFAYLDKFYYKQLNYYEKRYYEAAFQAAYNGEVSFFLDLDSITDYDGSKFTDYFDYAMEALHLDFSEYYWFKNWDFKKVLDTFLFTSTYHNITKDEIQEYNLLINKKIDEVLPLLITNDDYMTAKNIYDYIINNTEYDINYRDYFDVKTILYENKGVCSSYSSAFQLLCNKAGIECYSVRGFGDENFCCSVRRSNYEKYSDYYAALETYYNKNMHMWNIIHINDNWYWVDATWGDHTYTYSNNSYKMIDYSHLFIPDEIFFRDHLPIRKYEYPKCTDYSHFLLDETGMVLYQYDEKQLIDLIYDAALKNKPEFTLQFMDEENYYSALSWLKRNNLSDIYATKNDSGQHQFTSNTFFSYSNNYLITVVFLPK